MSNVQLVRDAYDCFGRSDLPTLLGMMEPNIQWSEAEKQRGTHYEPSGKAWHGRDAIVQNLFMKIGEDFDGTFVVHPKDFYDAGDTGRRRRALHQDLQDHGQELGRAVLPRIQGSRRETDELSAVRRHGLAA